LQLSDLSDVHPGLGYHTEAAPSDLYLSDPPMLPHVLVIVLRLRLLEDLDGRRDGRVLDSYLVGLGGGLRTFVGLGHCGKGVTVLRLVD